MARGRGGRHVSEVYQPYMVKLMNMKHGVEYAKDKKFTEAERLAVKPVDVCNLFHMAAYGLINPGPDDKPTVCRHSGLEQHKKAISYYMPHRDSPWNVEHQCGNPTRCTAVNDIIKKVVKKAQVRKEGKPSNAKRDLKRAEFRKTLCLMEGHRSGDMAHKVKHGCMMKFQFHVVARNDDICNVETADLRAHDVFKDFALQTKVSWSKNVMEERDCPDRKSVV